MPSVLAATQSTQNGGGFGFIIITVVVVGGLLFLINRSNGKRRAYAQQVQSAASVGSEVMTTSGIYGTVVGEDAESFLISVAAGVEIRFAKAAIARVITPDDPADAFPDAAGGADSTGAGDGPEEGDGHDHP